MKLTDDQLNLLKTGTEVIIGEASYRFLPFWFKTVDGMTEVIPLSRTEQDAPELYDFLGKQRERFPVSEKDILGKIDIERREEEKRLRVIEEYRQNCLKLCLPFTRKYFFAGSKEMQPSFLECYNYDGVQEHVEAFFKTPMENLDPTTCYVKAPGGTGIFSVPNCTGNCFGSPNITYEEVFLPEEEVIGNENEPQGIVPPDEL